jgi:hypothetical protein
LHWESQLIENFFLNCNPNPPHPQFLVLGTTARLA